MFAQSRPLPSGLLWGVSMSHPSRHRTEVFKLAERLCVDNYALTHQDRATLSGCLRYFALQESPEHIRTLDETTENEVWAQQTSGHHYSHWPMTCFNFEYGLGTWVVGHDLQLVPIRTYPDDGVNLSTAAIFRSWLGLLMRFGLQWRLGGSTQWIGLPDSALLLNLLVDRPHPQDSIVSLVLRWEVLPGDSSRAYTTLYRERGHACITEDSSNNGKVSFEEFCDTLAGCLWYGQESARLVPKADIFLYIDRVDIIRSTIPGRW